MAKASKLKVYRTAVGFHDAYVAAPSKKAALEAWGTTKDLFGRGAAELVTDEKLSAEPLANPGTVFKRSRGTAEEQIAALPPNKIIPVKPKRDEKPKAKTERLPKPSRAKVEAAERAIADAEVTYRKAIADVQVREANLVAERRKLQKQHDAAAVLLEADADRARANYDEAMASWRG